MIISAKTSKYYRIGQLCHPAMIKTGECGDFLESIIKVEPAEFQTIVVESVVRSKANPDDNLRSSVKRYSEMETYELFQCETIVTEIVYFSASGLHLKRLSGKVEPKKHQTLAKSDILLPLRSVIKVEPEEFQKTATFSDFNPTVKE